MAKNLAREILHPTFFMPRGDADIPHAIAGRIDYLHQMLGLQNDELSAAKNIWFVKSIRIREAAQR